MADDRFDSTGRRVRAVLSQGVTARAVALVAGVLTIQLAFIASYLGAFHHPTPHRVPVAVAAPAEAPSGTAAQAAARLNALSGKPLDARVVADEAAARGQIDDREVYGAYLLSPTGPDQLLVAGAAGASVSQALQQIFAEVTDAQGRTIAVQDVVPASAGDARGLSAFYLCVGWVIGGYLVASALSISKGSRSPDVAAAAVRLAALAVYAVASGLGGAIVTEAVLGALPGHLLALSAFGALLVFAVGAFTMGLQAVTGIVGIGLTVVLFVVLGNPSAGGAYAGPLLPAFWGAIGPWLPPGAGTSAVRGIVYFDGAGVATPVWLLTGYAMLGIVVATVAAASRNRRGQAAHFQ